MQYVAEWFKTLSPNQNSGKKRLIERRNFFFLKSTNISISVYPCKIPAEEFIFSKVAGVLKYEL